MQDEVSAETSLPRRAAESADLFGVTARLDPTEREMGTKWPPVDLVAESGTSHLDIMMEKLEARVGVHANPYYGRPPEVRKGADPRDADVRRRMALPDHPDRVGERPNGAIRLLAEELQRQMDSWLPDPRDVGAPAADCG